MNTLSSLPDISKWNNNNVNNMSSMFYNCKSLSSLPNITKWNTKNVNNMSYIFNICNSLSSLPDLSKWNTNNDKEYELYVLWMFFIIITTRFIKMEY